MVKKSIGYYFTCIFFFMGVLTSHSSDLNGLEVKQINSVDKSKKAKLKKANKVSSAKHRASKQSEKRKMSKQKKRKKRKKALRKKRKLLQKIRIVVWTIAGIIFLIGCTIFKYQYLDKDTQGGGTTSAFVGQKGKIINKNKAKNVKYKSVENQARASNRRVVKPQCDKGVLYKRETAVVQSQNQGKEGEASEISESSEVNESEVDESEVDESEVNESEVDESEVNESEVDESEVDESEVDDELLGDIQPQDQKYINSASTQPLSSADAAGIVLDDLYDFLSKLLKSKETTTKSPSKGEKIEYQEEEKEAKEQSALIEDEESIEATTPMFALGETNQEIKANICGTLQHSLLQLYASVKIQMLRIKNPEEAKKTFDQASA